MVFSLNYVVVYSDYNYSCSRCLFLGISQIKEKTRNKGKGIPRYRKADGHSMLTKVDRPLLAPSRISFLATAFLKAVARDVRLHMITDL